MAAANTPEPSPTAPVEGIPPVNRPAEPVTPAEPTKTKPVVLATPHHESRFIVPADDDGDDLVIDHTGVALPKKRAAEIEALAARNGVLLHDITPKGD